MKWGAMITLFLGIIMVYLGSIGVAFERGYRGDGVGLINDFMFDLRNVVEEEKFRIAVSKNDEEYIQLSHKYSYGMFGSIAIIVGILLIIFGIYMFYSTCSTKVAASTAEMTTSE